MIKEAGLNALRSELEDRLPDLLAAALARYIEFSETPSPEDAKGFAAHQSACKAALAHLDALLKLHRGMVATDQVPEDHSGHQDLIALADHYLESLDSDLDGDDEIEDDDDGEVQT